VWWQDCLEDCRTHGVPPAGDVEREIGGALLHARCATACHCGQIRRRLTSRDASLEWVVGPSLPGTRSQLTRKFSIDRGRQSGRPCGILGKSSGVSMVLVLRAFFPTALVGYARSDRAQTNAPGRLLVTRVNLRSVLRPGRHQDVDGRLDVSGGRANGSDDALVARSLEGVQTCPVSR
jgi:hypothetical protein